MKRWYAIELPQGRGWEHLSAESVRVEAGALVFTNGDVFNAEFVAAYGPTGWAWCAPHSDDCDCGRH